MEILIAIIGALIGIGGIMGGMLKSKSSENKILKQQNKKINDVNNANEKITDVINTDKVEKKSVAKKNGTLFFIARSLSSITQLLSIGLLFDPDSPPTISQSIPERLISEIDSNNGSAETNFTFAPVCLRSSQRSRAFLFSTDTPIQILSVQLIWDESAKRRFERFVRT